MVMVMLQLPSFILVAIAALMLVGSTNAQTITNLGYSPSGSGFYRGTSYTWSWNQNSVTSVYLRFCSDSLCIGTVYDTHGPVTVSGTSASLQYTFNVRGPTRAYAVVSSATDPTVKNAYYINAIYGKTCSITWTYPSSSIVAPRGSPITFTWTSTGQIASVDITLSSSSTLIYIVRNATNTGSYTWTPGANVPVQSYFTPKIWTNVTDPAYDPANAAGGYVSITYPSTTLTMTTMSSSTSMRPGESQILSWTFTPDNLVYSWNISLYYSSTNKGRVGSNVVGTSFTFTAPSDAEGYYYFLRLIPASVDPLLYGATISEDTGYISISKSNSGSGSSGSSTNNVGIAIGAVIVLAAGGAAAWRRWKSRQQRREFAKVQGIGGNPPAPPVVDDQYITEGIPLCYFETPHYAPPGAQPAVLLPVVSPVGHVVGLVPQH